MTGMAVIEINFDGLPGPTHNYSGLAEGNLASERHKCLASNPRQAALQGLAKMKALADRGFAQAVLPPHERPDVAALRALGFSGDDAQVLSRAARSAPQLLAACSSAAAMWVANAATVSPSADTADGRAHFTPANLVSHFHRSLEAPTTTRVLRAIFADDRHFTVHDALPSVPQFGDELVTAHSRQNEIGDHEIDFRSQIYSLGATMCFLLTGAVPLAVSGMKARLRTRRLPELRRAPRALRSLLVHMLRENPENRPQDPVAFESELRDCLTKIERRQAIGRRLGIPLAAVISQKPKKPREPKTPLAQVSRGFLAFALLLLAATALGAYLFPDAIPLWHRTAKMVGVPDASSVMPSQTTTAAPSWWGARPIRWHHVGRKSDSAFAVRPHRDCEATIR